MSVSIPAFGEEKFFQHRENNSAVVTLLPDVAPEALDAYGRLLLESGAEKKQEYTENLHRFAAYCQNGTGYFLNYYEGTKELSIVEESDTAYFSFADKSPDGARKTPQFTQVKLSDFGLLDVVRLPDGRFIVVDGGRNDQFNRDALLRTLTAGAQGDTPVIAAWFLTHPHSDHFHCFMGFMEQYGHLVKVEKMLLLFPEADDLAHYPALNAKEGVDEDLSAIAKVPQMWQTIAAHDLPVFATHTGQRYQIGDATCQLMATMDDTIHCCQDINATSQVIRMELAGQTLLLTTDAPLHISGMGKRYGSGLKADILQFPHHGFSFSRMENVEEQIAIFELIAPEVCLLPVADYHAYTSFCTFRESTAHLMCHPGVKEYLAGSHQRTLELPYTPTAYGAAERERNYRRGRAAAGACTWIFSDIPASAPDAFAFTLLNTTYVPATVEVDVYFESKTQVIERQRVVLTAKCLRQARCAADLIDADRLPRDLAPDAVFGIRFRSDIPIVVTHKAYAAAYFGEGLG
ncbi:MAG: hypothetical protein IJY16_04565 [Clostridia bacterium]|nr:hypothetical protein [Clostridia bacterium]